MISINNSASSTSYWRLQTNLLRSENEYRNTTGNFLRATARNSNNLLAAAYYELTSTEKRIIETRTLAENVDEYSNANSQSFLTANSILIARLRLQSSGAYSNVRIAEAFFYDSIPSGEDMQLVFNYIQNKYGIAIPKGL